MTITAAGAFFVDIIRFKINRCGSGGFYLFVSFLPNHADNDIDNNNDNNRNHHTRKKERKKERKNTSWIDLSCSSVESLFLFAIVAISVETCQPVCCGSIPNEITSAKYCQDNGNDEKK
jgi:hypothetical protein